MGTASSQVEHGPDPTEGQTVSSSAYPQVAKLDDSDEAAVSQLHAEGSAKNPAEPASPRTTVEQELKRTPRTATHNFTGPPALATPDATSGSDKAAATSTSKSARKAGKLPKVQKNRTPTSLPLSHTTDSLAATNEILIPNTPVAAPRTQSPSLPQPPSQAIPTSSFNMGKDKDKHHKKKRRKSRAEVTIDLSDPATPGADEPAIISTESNQQCMNDRSTPVLEGHTGSAEVGAQDAGGHVATQDVQVEATQERGRKRKRKSQLVEEPVVVPATQLDGNEVEVTDRDAQRPSKKRKKEPKSRRGHDSVLQEIQNVPNDDAVVPATQPGANEAEAPDGSAYRPTKKRKKGRKSRSDEVDVLEEIHNVAKDDVTNGDLVAEPHLQGDSHPSSPKKDKKKKKAKRTRTSEGFVAKATSEGNVNNEPILPSSLLRTLKSKKGKRNKLEGSSGGVPLDETHSAYDDSIASQLEPAANSDVGVQSSQDAYEPSAASEGQSVIDDASSIEYGEEPILRNEQEQISGPEQDETWKDAQEQTFDDGQASETVIRKAERKRSKMGRGRDNSRTPGIKKRENSRTVNPVPRARGVRGAQFELDNEQPLSEPVDLRERGEFSKDEAELIRRKIVEQKHLHDLDVADLVRLIQWTKPYGRDRTENATTDPGDVDEKAQSEASTAFWAEIYDVLPKRKGAKAKGGTTSIQRFVRRKYHNWTKGHGGWDEEEDEMLRQAYVTHPGSWKRISQELGNRSEDACRDRWRDYVQYGEGRNTKRWSAEEEESLVQIVSQALEKVRRSRPPPAECTSKDISWPWVSQQMGGSRSRVQCFMKWKALEGQKEEEDREEATKSLIKTPKRKSRRSAAGDKEEVVGSRRAARPLGIENMLWGDKLAVIAAFLDVDDAADIDWDNVAEIAKTRSGTPWPQEVCRAALDELLDEVGQQPTFSDAIVTIIDWLSDHHGDEVEQYYASNLAEAEAYRTDEPASSPKRKKAKASRKRKSGGPRTPAKRFTSRAFVTASDDED